MFKELLTQYASSTLRRAYANFQGASTDLEKRQILDRLNNSYGGSMDPSWLLPNAGPGTYKVTLRRGGESQQQSLEIREDPILKE